MRYLKEYGSHFSRKFSLSRMSSIRRMRENFKNKKIKERFNNERMMIVRELEKNKVMIIRDRRNKKGYLRSHSD